MRVDARMVLLLVNLLLLAALGWMWRGAQGGWQAPKPLSPALDGVISDGQFFLFDLKNMPLNKITEHPLFWPSRKPVPPQPKQAPPSKPKANPLKGAKLLGTFTSAAAGGAVLRVDGKKPKVLRLAVGESYQGLTLQKVTADSADFVDPKSGQSQTLTLEVAPQSQYRALPNTVRGRVLRQRQQAAIQRATRAAAESKALKAQSNKPARDPWVPPPKPRK